MIIRIIKVAVGLLLVAIAVSTAMTGISNINLLKRVSILEAEVASKPVSSEPVYTNTIPLPIEPAPGSPTSVPTKVVVEAPVEENAQEPITGPTVMPDPTGEQPTVETVSVEAQEPPALTPMPPSPTLAPTLVPPTPGPVPPAEFDPSGNFILITPNGVDPPTFGPTTFRWHWNGTPLLELVNNGYGFEVAVTSGPVGPDDNPDPSSYWGVHDAVEDSNPGGIQDEGNGVYSLASDISSGRIRANYLWLVRLINLEDPHQPTGITANPTLVRLQTEGTEEKDSQSTECTTEPFC